METIGPRGVCDRRWRYVKKPACHDGRKTPVKAAKTQAPYPGAQEAVYESVFMGRFVGIDLEVSAGAR